MMPTQRFRSGAADPSFAETRGIKSSASRRTGSIDSSTSNFGVCEREGDGHGHS